MKTIMPVKYVFSVSLITTMAWAQDQVIEQPPVQVVTSQTMTLPAPQAAQTQAAPQVIQPQPLLEQQPTTVIQASPLTQSKAEQLRNAREQAEVQTEQMIVEKLEQSRLEDERRRAQQLFGGLENQQAAPAPAPAVAAPAAPVEAAPAPVESGASIEEVRNAVREELAEVKKSTEVKESRNYFLGSFGISDYSYDNVENVGALGVAFGKQFDERWSVELGIHYSELYIDESYWVYRDMSQYGLNLTSRFNFMTGRVLPNAGLGLQYTRREYSAPRDGLNGMPINSFINEVVSDALDLAIVVGADFAIADRFMMGLEYRYIMNLAYKYSSDDQLNTPAYRNGFGWGSSQLEDTEYDFWGVTLKYLF